jgi:type IV pilus assembly protein PilN
MRVQLNLASRPFIELGPVYMRLRILIALLALLALPLWWFLSAENQKAAAAKARLDAVQQRIQGLQATRSASEAEMRQPQNAAVLTQSQFLNQMYARKSFSWTAVMMDLENVLPSGVQVLNIDPVVGKDGRVSIRLRVSGAHERAVDLVRNLEKSHRFLSPRLARETAETNQNRGSIEQVSATSNVNFDLVAEYNPLPDKPAAKTGEETKPASKAPSKTAVRKSVKTPKPMPKPNAAKKAGAQ